MQAVPAKLTRYGLSQVVNHLLGLGVGPIQAARCSATSATAVRFAGFVCPQRSCMWEVTSCTAMLTATSSYTFPPKATPGQLVRFYVRTSICSQANCHGSPAQTRPRRSTSWSTGSSCACRWSSCCWRTVCQRCGPALLPNTCDVFFIGTGLRITNRGLLRLMPFFEGLHLLRITCSSPNSVSLPQPSHILASHPSEDPDSAAMTKSRRVTSRGARRTGSRAGGGVLPGGGAAGRAAGAPPRRLVRGELVPFQGSCNFAQGMSYILQQRILIVLGLSCTHG